MGDVAQPAEPRWAISFMEALEKIAFDEVANLPRVFNVPIIDYSYQKIYCTGYFRKPTEEEASKYSKRPFAFFQPAEKHGWGMAFYSMEEVLAMIERAKPIK